MTTTNDRNMDAQHRRLSQLERDAVARIVDAGFTPPRAVLEIVRVADDGRLYFREPELIGGRLGFINPDGSGPLFDDLEHLNAEARRLQRQLEFSTEQLAAVERQLDRAGTPWPGTWPWERTKHLVDQLLCPDPEDPRPVWAFGVTYLVRADTANEAEREMVAAVSHDDRFQHITGPHDAGAAPAENLEAHVRVYTSPRTSVDLSTLNRTRDPSEGRAR